VSELGRLIGNETSGGEQMKYRVEIIRGINKGKILELDEDRAEAFVAEHKVRILQVITNDAPPEETPNFVEVATEVSGSMEPHELTPEPVGDELEDEERCIALTKSGERCKNARKEGDHCSTHAPKIVEAKASLILVKE
jgi:hypothetical protein